MGWIAVDLDGTLAQYDGWGGIAQIGQPVEEMANRVRRWLKYGHPAYGEVEVRIFTARVSVPEPERTIAAKHIENWCQEHLGVVLRVTNEKDFGMLEQWDDRAVQVEVNTGRRMDGQPDPEGPP